MINLVRPPVLWPSEKATIRQALFSLEQFQGGYAFERVRLEVASQQERTHWFIWN